MSKDKPVPPLGPKTNLRPSGPHDDKRRKLLEKEAEKEARNSTEPDPE